MLKNPLNLRQVEIFHAVMVNGTTQRAAEVLHISQPGISKAIQELERQLGFALFHRTRRRLVPTAEAHFYFREVEESFAALSRLRSAAARIRDFGSGVADAHVLDREGTRGRRSVRSGAGGGRDRCFGC